MLAGKMKLRNFVVIVVVAAGGAVAASYAACNKPSAPQKQANVVQPVVAPTPAPDAAIVVAPDAPVAATLAARTYDAEALAWQHKVIAGKGKDISKGRAYKINVYQDNGMPSVNRIKIDANRNNKFDDKITFKDGEILLEHAPADDENYTESYRWNGTGWTKR